MSELKPLRYKANTINGEPVEGYPIPVGPSKWKEGHKPEPKWFIQSDDGYESDDPIDMTTLEILDTRPQNDGLCEEIEILKSENKRLEERDCNATVELCFNDGNNPFARETLKIVDVGVSDNIYIVESEIVTGLQAELKHLIQSRNGELKGEKG